MKLKIYLADLTHTGLGTATEAFPLNIGVVASYCLKNFKDDVDVKLFKFPEELQKAIDEEKPDILSCSNYSWNCNLSYHFASYVKSLDKNILTVFGGTNYPYDAYNQKLFHKKRPNMDIHIFYEGEKAFTKIVERTLSSRRDIKKMLETPIDGCQFLREDGELVCGEKIKRIKYLDEIPSPYVNGLLDKFFPQKLYLLVETARGCPFKCNFCNAGDAYYNKVNQFSNEYVEEEFTYIAKKANKFDVRHVTICDNNFGMIPRDAKTAELIYKLKQKYSWPKSVSVWTGKNAKERVIDATRLLGETMSISMAVQSMDPKVLENISRANIKLDHYKAIAAELKSQGRAQHGEIISPLPGETFDSFTKGFSDLLDTDVTKVENHTIQILHGTPYADNKKYVEDHGYNIKSRIVPLDYGKYIGDEYVFDYEKVGVSTKDFSFDEYIESRKITLMANLCFNGNTFDALKKYVLSIGLKRSDWVKYLYKNMSKFDNSIKKIFESFANESKSELWDSEDEMVAYYSRKENYKKLINGEAGRNVVYSHVTMIMADRIQTLIDNVVSLSKEFIEDNGRIASYVAPAANINDELKELKKYIKCMTFDSFNFKDKLEVSKKFEFKYDIYTWLKTLEDKSLKDFYDEKSVMINFKYEQDTLDLKRDAFKRYGDTVSGIVKCIQRSGGHQRFHRKAVTV